MLARDFEAPVDAGNDNVYNLIVRAVDANGLIANQPVAISVTDINERASLSIGGLADFRAFEGSIYAAYANVTGAIGVVTWTVEGNDADLFTLNSSGLLELGPQTLNAPADKGADNTYNVTVRATDADGNTAAQPLAVTIINAPSRPAGKLVVSGLSDASLSQGDVPSVAGDSGHTLWSLEGVNAAQLEAGTAGRLALAVNGLEHAADRVATMAASTPTLLIKNLANASVSENRTHRDTPSVTDATGRVTWSLEGADAGSSP